MSNLSLAASNLSLAASEHREDGAQRGSSSQRGGITSRPTGNRPPKQRRSGSASRPSTQGGRSMMIPTGRRPPKQDRSEQDSCPADAGGRIVVGYLRISGQCNNCEETNHVTQTCRHQHVLYMVRRSTRANEEGLGKRPE